MNNYINKAKMSDDDLNGLVEVYLDEIENTVYKKLYPNGRGCDMIMYPRKLFIEEGINLITTHPNSDEIDKFDLVRVLNKKHYEIYNLEGSEMKDYVFNVEEMDNFAHNRLKELKKKEDRENRIS